MWLVEGFFDVPETQDDSTNNYKALEKLNPKAHDAYLLFQVLIACWLPTSNHFMHIGYSPVNQWRPIDMVACKS